MGYDCTLHVIDPAFLDGEFTDVVLGKAKGGAWAKGTSKALATLAKGWKATDDKEAGALLGQVALVASAAAGMPYHYERQFALSLWSDQPDGLDAKVPKKLLGDPAELFPRLTKARPGLKGNVLGDFESNYSTGNYVPAAHVPELLAWAEKRVKKYPKADQRLFRGLLLVLREAAKRGLAYWEGTDLPVEMKTIEVPDEQRDREALEWKLPDGYWGPQWCRAGRAVLGDTHRALCILDLRTWPPGQGVHQRWWPSFDEQRDGGPVVAVELGGSVVRRYFELELEDRRAEVLLCSTMDATSGRMMEVRSIAAPTGVREVRFFGDRVVAEGRYENGYPYRRIPMMDNGTGALTPVEGVELAEDRHATSRDEAFGEDRVDMEVVRLADGSDVLLWKLVGYELRGGRFEATFDLRHRPSWQWGYGSGREKHRYTYVPHGPDGFLHAVERKLALARRGRPLEWPLPAVENLMTVTPSGDGGIVSRTGRNKAGRAGALWYPDRGVYYDIDAEAVLPDEDPEEWRSIMGDATGERLLVLTPRRIWSVPMARVKAGPARDAVTGRKKKGA